MKIKTRLKVLRSEMKKNNIAAYIIFSSDPHMNEYLAEHWKIREYFSGFTGSVGNLVITADHTGLWTDSRYFIQAEKQLENTGIRLFKENTEGTPDILKFLTTSLTEQDAVGVNPLCCPVATYQKIHKQLSQHNIMVKDIDLINNNWKGRPSLTKNEIFLHPEKYCGETTESKLNRIREAMKNHGVEYHFLGSLDDIAWIFNLRGSDIPCNPVFFSYALISKNKAILFIDNKKLTTELHTYLHQNNVEVKNYNEIFDVLKTLRKDTSLLIDLQRTNQQIFNILNEQKIIKHRNPSQLMKSIKNRVEIEGIKKTMIFDGIAMINFWYWLEKNKNKGINEIDIADKLLELRTQQPNFAGISFDTIAGYNANGAIVHYKATKQTAATIHPKGFLLVDSGGQYLSGTTDITRTFSLSGLSKEEKTDFTLVLKGMIRLSLAKFPKGTRGCNIDVIARKPLWDNGRNYGHGTGHGVGAFLNVHEGPQNIRQDLNDQVLLPGMLTSNEPGLYRENKYGIRLENLILCKEDTKTVFGEFLCFETLTLCPFDMAAVYTDRLNKKEKNWLNNYHSMVYEKLSSHLSPVMKDWLKGKCKRI